MSGVWQCLIGFGPVKSSKCPRHWCPWGEQVYEKVVILYVRLPSACPAGRLADLVRITGQALSGEVQADSAFVEPFLGGLFTLASGGLH
jgi:hypothetical protein